MAPSALRLFRAVPMKVFEKAAGTACMAGWLTAASALGEAAALAEPLTATILAGVSLAVAVTDNPDKDFAKIVRKVRRQCETDFGKWAEVERIDPGVIDRALADFDRHFPAPTPEDLLEWWLDAEQAGRDAISRLRPYSETIRESDVARQVVRQIMTLAMTRAAASADFAASRQPEALKRLLIELRGATDMLRAIDRRTEGMAVEVSEVLAIVRQLQANQGAATALPQEPAITDAVQAAVRQAEAGDQRMALALALLRDGETERAETLFREVAEERAAEARTNAREAAAAYRHLGAIAGLGDPKRALDAYLKALELDPDDAESLIWAAEIQTDRGELGEAEAKYRRLLNLPVPVVTAHRRFWAQLGLGDIQVARGNLSGAEEMLSAAASVAQRTIAAQPDDLNWNRNLSVSHERIGNVRRDQGDLAGALERFQAGLDFRRRLAAADPGNAVWQCDLSVSHDKVGDVRRDQGNLEGALESYRAGLDMRQRLAAADPGNAVWQRDLSVSHNKVGDVRRDQGDLAGALESYQAGLNIRQRLAAADPGNAGWQRDLSVSHHRIGDVRRDQGDLAGALESYRAGLDIRQRLAAADPDNAGWQRDLSVSHNRIGDVRRDQGDLAGALESYRADLAIAERLAAADPGNAGWQRDLSVSHTKVGDVRLDQGDLAGALESHEAGLAIAQRLAAADPGNAGWQRDLALSIGRAGANLAVQGDIARARWHLENGRAIIQALMAKSPGWAVLRSDLQVFDAELAALPPD